DRLGRYLLRMDIRRLLPADAAAFQSLRLQGLREAPTAFGSSHEEEQGTPVASVAERIATNTRGFIPGAFERGTPGGVGGLRGGKGGGGGGCTWGRRGAGGESVAGSWPRRSARASSWRASVR